jgi:hypothetical protein
MSCKFRAICLRRHIDMPHLPVPLVIAVQELGAFMVRVVDEFSLHHDGVRVAPQFADRDEDRRRWEIYSVQPTWRRRVQPEETPFDPSYVPQEFLQPSLRGPPPPRKLDRTSSCRNS